MNQTLITHAPLLIALMVTVCTVCAGIGWFFIERGSDNAVRDRIDTYIRSVGDGTEVDTTSLRADMRRKQVNQKLKSLAEKQKFSRSRLGSVKARIVQAGLDVSITSWWIGCLIFGLLCAAGWFNYGPQPLAAPVAFAVGTFFLPKFWLSRRIGKRQASFTAKFPQAVDIMVRGLRAGMPLQESIRVVCMEIEEPVGSEFRLVMDQVNAGLSLAQALDRAYERLPTQELRFFATIISVQEQNGGNLSEILSKISDVLRGRAQLREKAKALSGEARMSAIIVGALPFLVSTVLFFANREYLSLLWTSRIGNYFLAGACFMMFMGIFIMNKMGQLDV